jgi:LPS sulfotransferase NodH
MLQVRGDVACASELFNPRLIAEHNLEWLPHRSASTEELLRLRQADPAALLERLWADGASGGATLVGFKLLYGHGVIDDRILDALQAEPDLAVVHLLRADRLQRWLSLARSLATDDWFAAAGATAATQSAPIELAPQATATEFALGELFEARYRATFAAHRSLELDYEDLAQHLPASAQRLGAFLGCDLGVMTPRSQKTGSRDLVRSIANLGELRAAFVGSRWAGLFD